MADRTHELDEIEKRQEADAMRECKVHMRMINRCRLDIRTIRNYLRDEIPKDGLTILGKYVDRRQRCCSMGINYILERWEVLPLAPETAYLAVMYLVKYVKENRIIQSVSIETSLRIPAACLALAWKWQNSPRFDLSQLCTDNTFSTDDLLELQIDIQRKFKWKMALVTPFHYVNYFMETLIPERRHRRALQTIGKNILTALKDVNTMHQRSSIVALAALMQLITEHKKDGRIKDPPLDYEPLAIDLGLNIEDARRVISSITHR